MAKQKKKAPSKATIQAQNLKKQQAAKNFKVISKKKYEVAGATDPKKVQEIIEQKRATGKKLVLHVGCGDLEKGSGLHRHFKTDEWVEVRLDIEPKVKPDIVSDIRDMRVIADNSVDAIWSSHNIEHVFPHEVPQTLSEFYRVLKVGGMMLIATPDMQSVCEEAAKKGLETVLYRSPAGPITPLDIMYGHIASIERGAIYMAHKGAFTAVTIGRKMFGVGCRNIRVQRDQYNLTAVGYKTPQGAGSDKIEIVGNDINEMMRKRDQIDMPPESKWEGLGFDQ